MKHYSVVTILFVLIVSVVGLGQDVFLKLTNGQEVLTKVTAIGESALKTKGGTYKFIDIDSIGFIDPNDRVWAQRSILESHAHFKPNINSGGQIEKGNNLIIITGGNSANDNFDIVAKHLISRGFSFATIEKDYLQIVTNPKPYAGSFNYKLVVSFELTKVYVRVNIQLMNLAQQLIWTDWKYAKSRGSLYNNAFVKFNPVIEEIANKIGTVAIEFNTE